MMTATCPPALTNELLLTLGIRNCRIIRAPTNRPEISYNVDMSKTISEARKKLVTAIEARKATFSPTSRGLVYCRGRKTTETIAELIGCKPFHSNRPVDERKATFTDWVAGKEQFIVSTSLLGCGIDVDGVEVVYHFQTPHDLMGYVQESGRAGRRGDWAESWVFASEEDWESDDPTDHFGREAMRKWVRLTSSCRRIEISSFLDGRVTTCMLLPGANLCDVCKKQAKEQHPRRPVEINVTPPTYVPKIGPLPPVPPPSIEYARERLEAPLVQK